MKNKKLLLLLLLVVLALGLSGCYMEPDTIVGDGNGLTVGQNQQFDTVITATPELTPTPTPVATSSTQQVDWSAWDFGNDTATNPPSNVISVGGNTQTQPTAQTGGTISVTPTPTPTPATGASSTVLKTGSQGSEVKRLQTRLKELGYYTGSVDGSYGTGTVNAVMAFQAANKLTQDGVAGKSTQEAIYSYYAVAKKDATVTAKPSATKKPTTSSTTTNNNTTTNTNQYTNGKTDVYLKLGSSGAQVKILQNRLIVLGYLSGTADGNFEETTESAVIAFQKRNKIYADGIAGPSTLKMLYSSSAKKATAVVANIGSLKEGMNGSGVRALQQQLKNLGYYTGSVDGDFGAGTKTAVIAFQAANGLTQDGVAGKQTLNAIYGGGTSSGGGSSGGSSNASVYALSASTNGYSSLSTGSTNNANVTALQTALKSSGYYSGSVDGSYGNGTSNAVTAFQKAKGLRADGIAGPTTQRLLYGRTSDSGSYSKLESGSTGTAVKNLQYTLYELRYYDGDISGRYDSATQSAVVEFQQNNQLTADGIAGQATQRLLYSSYAMPAGKGSGGTSSSSGGSSSGTSYPTVSQGEASDNVLMIQQQLISLGYMSNLTSVYDAETVSAVAAFVSKNTSKLDAIGGSYKTDGTVCGNTIQALLFDGSPNRN